VKCKINVLGYPEKVHFDKLFKEALLSGYGLKKTSQLYLYKKGTQMAIVGADAQRGMQWTR